MAKLKMTRTGMVKRLKIVWCSGILSVGEESKAGGGVMSYTIDTRQCRMSVRDNDRTTTDYRTLLQSI